MSLSQKTIALLGYRATDKVTGFHGVISSVCFDLYGCVQVALTPPLKDGDADLKSGHWFDVQRLNVSTDRVMPTPDFDARAASPTDYDHGPAPKPALSVDGRR